MQYYRVRQASPPLKGLKSVQAGTRQPYQDSKSIKFDRGRSHKAKVWTYWSSHTSRPNLGLNRINTGDGAAIFLVGTAGLTVNIRTWTKIAGYQDVTKTPTALIIFATHDSQLRKTGRGMDVGGDIMHSSST